MIPAKRPVSLRPLPKTSQPKALLSARRPTPKLSSSGSNKRSKWLWAVLAGLFLLVGAGAAYALGFIGPDSRVAEMKALGAKMHDKNLSDADRKAARDAFRKQMGSLTEAQRRALFNHRGFRGRRDDTSRIQKIFAMSPADRVKELDKDIDNMLEWQKKREEREKQRQEDAAKDKGSGDPNSQNQGHHHGWGGAPTPISPTPGITAGWPRFPPIIAPSTRSITNCIRPITRFCNSGRNNVVLRCPAWAGAADSARLARFSSEIFPEEFVAAPLQSAFIWKAFR